MTDQSGAACDDPRTVTVQTGARLHCGLFSDHREGGRRFQGFGIMVDAPGFQLSARPLAHEEHHVRLEPRSWQTVQEQEDLKHRLLEGLARLDRALPGGREQGLQVDVLNWIPQHVGLGSGTQLALAVGTAWNFFQPCPLSIMALAEIQGRGKRSCIGTHGFEKGGLLIDAGMRPEESGGGCRLATPLPEEWRFVLATPTGLRGLAGTAETLAFQRLPRLDGGTVDRLGSLLADLERQHSHFEAFSEILREFGLLVGQSFAAVQGGRFVHSYCETLFSTMNETGIRGVAQTSWGPTMFGVCENFNQAEQVANTLETLPDVQVRIVAPLNRGAALTTTPETSGSPS